MVNLRTWMESGPDWKGAACVSRQDLPWVGICTDTGEVSPSPATQREMAQVCADCPILYTCARHALETKGIGGFYAGIWLPWPQQGGGPRARRVLRKAFGKVSV